MNGKQYFKCHRCLALNFHTSGRWDFEALKRYSSTLNYANIDLSSKHRVPSLLPDLVMGSYSIHITIDLFLPPPSEPATHAKPRHFTMPPRNDDTPDDNKGKAAADHDHDDYDDDDWEFPEEIPFCGVDENLISLDSSSGPWNAYHAAACPSTPKAYPDNGSMVVIGSSHYILCSSHSQPEQSRDYQWPPASHGNNSPPTANDEWALVLRDHHHDIVARTTPLMTALSPQATSLTINVQLENNHISSSSAGSGPSSGSSESSSAPSSRRSSSHHSDVNDTILRQGPCTMRFELPCEFQRVGCDGLFDSEHAAVEWTDHVEGHLQVEFPLRVKCCT